MSSKSINVRIYETNRDLTNYEKNINNSLVKNQVLLIDFQTHDFKSGKHMNRINISLLKLSPLRRIDSSKSFMPQNFTIKNEL